MSEDGSPRGPRGATARFGGTVVARPGGIALIVLAALGVVLTLVAVLQFRDFLSDRSSGHERARLFATRDLDDAASHVDAELETFAALVRDVAGALGGGELARTALDETLLRHVAALHNVNGFAVGFEPDADAGADAVLVRAVRRHGELVLETVDDAAYTSADWYARTKSAGEAGWASPLPGLGDAMLAAYAAPFTLPADGEARFGGVVLGTYEIAHFAYEPAWLDVAADGYAFVVSGDGDYVSHPLVSWVEQPLDPSATCGLPHELATCEERAAFVAASAAAAARKDALIEISDPLTGEPAWLTVAPVPGPRWTLGAVVLERSLLARTESEQRELVRGGIAAIAAAALILLVVMRVDRISTPRLWLAAGVISVAALSGIGWIWYLELTTPATVGTDASGEGFLEQVAPYRNEGIEEVYAGAFVQSIEFTGANDVVVTGVVWQVFRGETAEERGVEPGFVFPEAEDLDLELAYDVTTDAGQKIGWRFNATLREVFDHRQYPFDTENVWLRMRPRELTKPVLLLPDVPAYELLAPSALPGVAHDILIEGWSVDDSFFSYRLNTYNANFTPLNLVDPDAGELMPELYFNVLISRLFINPFVSNMVPLFVVLFLLFAVLLLITRHEERSQVFGFNTIGVLGYCAALFFVVIVAHNELRSSLGAGQVIYLEQFYFAAYVAILAVSVNSILFSAGRGGTFIQFRDNLIPQLLYWPVTLLAMLALTFFAFD